MDLLDDGRVVVQFDKPGIGFNGGTTLHLGLEDLELVESEGGGKAG